MEFGIADTVTKVVEALLAKVKCSLRALDKIFIESDLLDLFKEFRENVETVLRKDVKKCTQNDGLINKLK